ncbi:MAG: bis(5'-nucleosyl)-tetraphosphatase (symmetrical) YqeK [Eubacteriales bacterium]|nr:bis(5'-nucleosyl)-tetraphosphatase (symmetrical) YqeK [Eubacteriales bacterium]
MYNIDEYKNEIRSRLSDYRFYHSLCVAESAKQLAEKYGADTEKALVAGLLHDSMKESSREEQLEYVKLAGIEMTPFEKTEKKFLHQVSGAAFAKVRFGITDEEILGAIRYHTTGRANMTLLEEIVYLADFVSADRDYDDVDVMRAKTESSKEEGLLYCTKYTISSVVEKGKILNTDTVDTYNWILQKYFSKE